MAPEAEPELPETPEAWRAWLARQRLDAAAALCIRPGDLIGAVHREEAQTRGYRGRELVELLQNADDAGEGQADGNDVAIALIRAGLAVANAGTVFSPGGVESLMIANNSPKRLSRSRFIGNKGLGFRSVLSWTECPIVLSGALDLAFSRDGAERWLASVCAENTRLEARVALHRGETGRHWPVPILACPFYLDEPVGLELTAKYAGPFEETRRLAQSLRSRGFATVVALPFTRAEAHDAAVDQLRHIGRDALLFTRHLRSLAISRDGVGVGAWTVLRGPNEILLSDGSNETSLWRTVTSEGEVPEEFWSEATYAAAPTWEVKLAVPTDASEIRGFLYCFFPTQVRFPYPVVAHATMEMTENRQHLVQTTENRFVAMKLAESLAQLAETSTSVNDPWSAVRVVAVQEGGQVDASLIDMGFVARLDAYLAARKVVPTRGAGFVPPPRARLTEVNHDGWLPGIGFEDVVPWTEDASLRRALVRMNVPRLDTAELKRRIETVAPRLDLDARATIVAGLFAAKLTDGGVPSILVDHAGALLPASQTSFLPPTDGWSVALPSWMEVRFLLGDLVERLRRAHKVENVRDLSTRLKAWNVREYSLAGIASHLSARLRERVAAMPARADEARAEALAAIFAIFVASPGSACPADLRVELPTVSGPWKTADQLYFSSDAHQGRLIGALFKTRPDLIAASTDQIAPGADTESVARFLEWVGVARLPRPRWVTPEPGYRDFLGRRLQYPIDLGDWHPSKPDDFYAYGLQNCASVEGLEDILAGADPEAILAWVSEDPRWDAWVKDGDPAVAVYPPRAQNARRIRDQHVPAYALWKIETAAWLTTHQGGRRAPARCLQQGATAAELRKIVPVPLVRSDHPCLDLGTNPRRRLSDLLRRIGVAPSLSELSLDDCLDIVQELPAVDPSGETARALYREVIARPDEARPSEAARSAYRAGARLRGRHGETAGWFAVGELFYDDQGALPAALRRQLPLLDLDTKLAVRNVRELLGVQSIDAQSVDVAVAVHDAVPRAAEVRAKLKGLCHFFLCLSPSPGVRSRVVSALRAFSLVLCRTAAGSAKVYGKEYPFSLTQPGERIAAGSDVYLIGDPGESGTLFDDPVFADRVAQAIAGVLRNNAAGADIARLLTCRKDRRTDLLAQIRGWTRERADAELKECAAMLDMAVEEIDLAPTIPVPPEQPAPPQPGPPAPPVPVTPPPPPGSPPVSPPTAVTLSPVTVPPMKPVQKVRFRVRATPRGSIGSGGGRQVADGAECERLAELFEVAELRFPLPVGHLQGDRALGCDLVSFKTEREREAFSADTSLHSTVERFIEVKGRSSATGVIDLRGNELERARDFGARYWIYRVFDMGDGSYDFVILPDPTEGYTREVLEINLLRSTAALGYLVEAIDPDPPAPTNAATTGPQSSV
jgi:hypothetical protein